MNVTRTYSIVAGLATWFWGMIMGVMALNGARANGSSEAATRRWFAIGAGAMISLLPLVAQADISVPALNYDEAKARMAGLIAKFDARYAEVMSKHFSEHRDREEFIDEFFAILGWDVDNVRAIVFKPTGKMAVTLNRYVAVSESTYSGTNLTATNPKNWIDVTIDQFTGRVTYGAE